MHAKRIVEAHFSKKYYRHKNGFIIFELFKKMNEKFSEICILLKLEYEHLKLRRANSFE